MPVRKFKTLQDMEDANWYEPGAPRLLEAIERVWRFARETCPVHIPPGVYRHRSIEEAQALREEWEEANFRALWASRGVDPKDLGRAEGLSEHLESDAGTRSAQEEALDRIRKRADQVRAGSGGRRWTRDELHER